MSVYQITILMRWKQQQNKIKMMKTNSSKLSFNHHLLQNARKRYSDKNVQLRLQIKELSIAIQNDQDLRNALTSIVWKEENKKKVFQIVVSIDDQAKKEVEEKEEQVVQERFPKEKGLIKSQSKPNSAKNRKKNVGEKKEEEPIIQKNQSQNMGSVYQSQQSKMLSLKGLDRSKLSQYWSRVESQMKNLSKQQILAISKSLIQDNNQLRLQIEEVSLSQARLKSAQSSFLNPFFGGVSNFNTREIKCCQCDKEITRYPFVKCFQCDKYFCRNCQSDFLNKHEECKRHAIIIMKTDAHFNKFHKDDLNEPSEVKFQFSNKQPEGKISSFENIGPAPDGAHIKTFIRLKNGDKKQEIVEVSQVLGEQTPSAQIPPETKPQQVVIQPLNYPPLTKTKKAYKLKKLKMQFPEDSPQSLQKYMQGAFENMTWRDLEEYLKKHQKQ